MITIGGEGIEVRVVSMNVEFTSDFVEQGTLLTGERDVGGEINVELTDEGKTAFRELFAQHPRRVLLEPIRRNDWLRGQQHVFRALAVGSTPVTGRH
jgi:hypothetical protein